MKRLSIFVILLLLITSGAFAGRLIVGSEWRYYDLAEVANLAGKTKGIHSFDGRELKFLADSNSLNSIVVRENFNGNQGSLEFWLRMDWNPYLPAYPTYLFRMLTDVPDTNFLMLYFGGMSASNVAFYMMYDSVDFLMDDTNYGAWRSGDWHHLVFTWDSQGFTNGSDHVTLYIDGARQTGLSATFSMTGIGDYWVGMSDDSRLFPINGTFMGRMLDRALTAREVEDLNASGAGNIDTLVTDTDVLWRGNFGEEDTAISYWHQGKYATSIVTGATESAVTCTTDVQYSYADNDPVNVYDGIGSRKGAYVDGPPAYGFSIGANDDSGGTYEEVWGDDTWIYAATGASGIRAYLFENGAFSSEGFRDDGGYAYGVWYDGSTYIHLANFSGGIAAYTFNGAAFSLIDTDTQASNLWRGVWGDGTYIYAANDTDGLHAYSFGGATYSHITKIDNGGNYENVHGDGTYIYAARRGNGVSAYSFNGSTFTHIDNDIQAWGMDDVWYQNGYLFVAAGIHGLAAYTFDGATLAEVANIDDTSSEIEAIWGDGTNIYAACNTAGISAYSFNGIAFTNIAQRYDAGSASGVWGDGTYYYLASGTSGIYGYSLEPNLINVDDGAGAVVADIDEIGVHINHDTQYYAEAANATIHDVTTEDVCLSYWIKMEEYDVSQSGRMFGNRGSAGTGYGLFLASDGRVYLRMNDGTDDYVCYTATGVWPAIAGTWHHIAGRLDRDNAANCDIFLDGVELSVSRAGTLGDVGSLTNAKKLTIGAAADNVSDPDFYVMGRTGDFKIYYAAGANWSDAEILYQVTHPFDYGASAGTITDYWECRDNTGTTVTGNVNNLTLSDVLAWDQQAFLTKNLHNDPDGENGAIGGITIGSNATVSKDTADPGFDERSVEIVWATADDNDECTLDSPVLQSGTDYFQQIWLYPDAIHDDSTIYLDVDGAATPLFTREIGKSQDDHQDYDRYFSLDGTEFFQAANNTIHDISTEDIGLSAWIRVASPPSSNIMMIASKATGTVPGIGYSFYIMTGTGYLQFYMKDAGSDLFYIRSWPGVCDNEWHHVGVIIDRDNAANCRIYIDGGNAVDITGGTIGNVDSLTNTGILTWGASSVGTYEMTGEIRDMAIGYPSDILAAGEMGEPMAEFALGGQRDDGGNYEDIWADGSYIFATTGGSGLEVYSFDGTNFTEEDVTHPGSYAYGVWYDGSTYVHIGNWALGVRAYSWDGATLTPVDSDTQGTNLWRGLWGDGTYIYATNDTDGLHAYSFGGATYTHITKIDNGGNYENVHGDGTYIYAAQRGSGVSAYTFDGANFTQKGQKIDVFPMDDVWCQNGYIFTTGDAWGLFAYTFNGTTFTQVGTIDDTSSGYEAVWGDGTYIFTACLDDGIRAYSFDGSTFTNLGHSDDAAAGALGVGGDGTYVYLAHNTFGIFGYSYDFSGTFDHMLDFDHHPGDPGNWPNTEDFWLCRDDAATTVVVGQNNDLTATTNTDTFAIENWKWYEQCWEGDQNAAHDLNLRITGAGAGTNTSTVRVDKMLLWKNMVSNGGIEGGADPPAGWTQEANATVTSVTGFSHSGSNDMQVTCTADHVGAKQNVTLVAGRYYFVSAWMRSGIYHTGELVVDTGDTTLKTIGTLNSWPWRRVAGTFLSTGTNGVIYLRATATGHYVYFDDVAIIPLDETLPTADSAGDGKYPKNTSMFLID